jgi:uncharacterized protein YndB with AHSA1/START domain
MPPYYQSTHSFFIQAPLEKVYEALTDWALRTRWRKGIEIQWEGDSKAFLNQKVTFKVGGFPPSSFSFRVAGMEPPRRLYLEYLGRPLRGRAAIELTPENNGCQAAFHWMKVEPVGWPARIYFALGLGMRSHRTRTLATLRLLKQHLEKGNFE